MHYKKYFFSIISIAISCALIGVDIYAGEKETSAKIEDYLSQGKNFYRQDKLQKAIDAWQKVLEIDPNNSQAQRYIERAKERTQEIKINQPPPEEKPSTKISEQAIKTASEQAANTIKEEEVISTPSEITQGAESLISTPPELAQVQKESTKNFTLKDCIQTALDNSISLRTAKKEMKLSKQKAKDAWRALFPAASVKWEEINGTTTGEDFHGREFYLELQQPIYQGGRLVNTLSQARLNIKVARDNYQKTKNDLVYEVEQAYHILASAKKTYRELVELLTLAKRDYNTAEKEFNLQLEREIDFLNVKSLYQESEYKLLSNQKDLILAYITLYQTLNVNAEQQSIDIPETSQPKILEIDPDKCAKLALENRPDLQIKETLYRFNKYGIEIARSQNKLKVDLTASGGYKDQVFITEEMDLQPEWYVGLKGSIPIGLNTFEYAFIDQNKVPDAGQTTSTQFKSQTATLRLFDNTAYTSITEALVNLDRAKDELQKMENSVTFETKQDFYEFQKAVYQLSNSATKLRLNEVELAIVSAQRDLNMASTGDLLRTRVKLWEAKTGYHQAVAGYFTSIAKLNKTIGISGYFDPMGEPYAESPYSMPPPPLNIPLSKLDVTLNEAKGKVDKSKEELARKAEIEKLKQEKQKEKKDKEQQKQDALLEKKAEQEEKERIKQEEKAKKNTERRAKEEEKQKLAKEKEEKRLEEKQKQEQKKQRLAKEKEDKKLEEQKLKEEKKQQEELKKKTEQEEKEKIKQEEKAKEEAEQKLKEEKKLEEQKRKGEEEKNKKDEALRLKNEEKQQAELKKKAEQEEKERIKQEEKTKKDEEQKAKEEEKQKLAKEKEEKQLEEKQKQELEKQRLAKEKEEKKLEEQKHKEEEKKLKEEQKQQAELKDKAEREEKEKTKREEKAKKDAEQKIKEEERQKLAKEKEEKQLEEKEKQELEKQKLAKEKEEKKLEEQKHKEEEKNKKDEALRLKQEEKQQAELEKKEEQTKKEEERKRKEEEKHLARQKKESKPKEQAPKLTAANAPGVPGDTSSAVLVPTDVGTSVEPKARTLTQLKEIEQKPTAQDEYVKAELLANELAKIKDETGDDEPKLNEKLSAFTKEREKQEKEVEKQEKQIKKETKKQEPEKQKKITDKEQKKLEDEQRKQEERLAAQKKKEEERRIKDEQKQQALQKKKTEREEKERKRQEEQKKKMLEKQEKEKQQIQEKIKKEQDAILAGLKKEEEERKRQEEKQKETAPQQAAIDAKTEKYNAEAEKTREKLLQLENDKKSLLLKLEQRKTTERKQIEQYTAQGNSYYENKDYSSAIKEYYRASALDPYDAKIKQLIEDTEEQLRKTK